MSSVSFSSGASNQLASTDLSKLVHVSSIQPSLTQVARPNLEDLAEPPPEPLPLADQPAPDQAGTGNLPLADQPAPDQADAGNDASQGAAPAAANAESEPVTSQLIQITDPEVKTVAEALVEVKQEPRTPEPDSDMDKNLKQIRDFWQKEVKIKQEKMDDEGRALLQTREPAPFLNLHWPSRILNILGILSS